MTSTEVNISSLDDGDVNQRYDSAEPPDEFLTFEQLFTMSNVEQLRAPTLAILKTLKSTSIDADGNAIEIPRFTDTAIEEAMIGFNLMADLHRGRARRNTGYDESTHPALVGILDLLANTDLTVDQLVTDYLHDTIEDCQDLGITSRHISKLLEIGGYPQARAQTIALGVEGLTRDDPNDQIGYIQKIKAYDQHVPQLRLTERKLADTTHTMMSYTWEMKNRIVRPEKAKKYADGKAGSTLLALGEPATPNALRLRQAISEFNEELALRNENAHHMRRRFSSQQTIFTARVRALSPTR